MRLTLSRLTYATLFSLATASAASAAAETYTIDPTHTAVTWQISHFDFSRPSGKFMNVQGAVSLDEKKPEASSVKITLALDGVNTGVAKLDEHLKSKDFFDAATYPTATFESTSVKITGKETANVTGNLTLHGVTKPVTLAVKLNKLADNMFKKHTAGFSASTTLKRSDFGITTYLPGLGDDVKIDIESEANLAAATPAAPAAGTAH